MDISLCDITKFDLCLCLVFFNIGIDMMLWSKSHSILPYVYLPVCLHLSVCIQYWSKSILPLMCYQANRTVSVINFSFYLTACPHHEQIQIAEDAVGFSYTNVFSRFLDGSVISVEIEDPYIRNNHQVVNFSQV